MQIDHIGYAVKRIGKSIAAFSLLGYSFDETVRDEKRNIDIAFGRKDGYTIELVCPIGPGSPVDDVLKKNGSTAYHICYVSDNLEAEIEQLKTKRFKVMLPPDSSIAFGGRRVVFLYQPAIGLMEIVEK